MLSTGERLRGYLSASPHPESTRQNPENYPFTGIATHADNMRNRKKVGFKGVRFRNGKWYARITVNRKEISLGHFLHLQDAANSYDIAAKKYFGDFAYTNGEIS
jgi:hypothetical protein